MHMRTSSAAGAVLLDIEVTRRRGWLGKFGLFLRMRWP